MISAKKFKLLCALSLMPLLSGCERTITYLFLSLNTQSAIAAHDYLFAAEERWTYTFGPQVLTDADGNEVTRYYYVTKDDFVKAENLHDLAPDAYTGVHASGVYEERTVVLNGNSTLIYCVWTDWDNDDKAYTAHMQTDQHGSPIGEVEYVADIDPNNDFGPELQVLADDVNGNLVDAPELAHHCYPALMTTRG